jgi:hypothetical protein
LPHGLPKHIEPAPAKMKLHRGLIMVVVLLTALRAPARDGRGCAQLPAMDGRAGKETIVKIVLISIKFKLFSANLRVHFKLW